MRKNKSIIITTSWDDGHTLDLKLAKLLNKYKIPATFYIPLKSSKQKIISSTQIRKLSKTFEVGCHTKNHVNLTKVNYHEASSEILAGKEGLEKILQNKVTMISYPFGSYNSKVTSIAKKSGFLGARNTRVFFTKNSKNKFEINTTIHASNHPLSFYFRQIFASSNKFLFCVLLLKWDFRDWENMSNESLKYVLKNGGIWHLWGHSWEIEKNNDWDKLERVFKHINQIKHKRPEIILSTNSELISKTKK